MPNLITISDLQSVCGLNQGVEARKVDHWVVVAQRRLEKIMGRAGYAAMVAAGTSDAAWTDLWTDYIKEFLCWYTLELAYPGMSAEADRGGVFVKVGEKMTPVDGKNLSMLQASARSAREECQDRLLDHLVENASTYTWYGTQTGDEERISDTGGGGIVMRKSEYQQPYRG